MNKATQDYYFHYKSFNNQKLVGQYHKVVMKMGTKVKDPNSNSIQGQQLLSEYLAISQLLEERDINIASSVSQHAVKEDKRKRNKEIGQFATEGVKQILIGAGILIVGWGLTALSEGYLIFRGAMFLGGLLLLIGLFQILASGFIKVRFWNKLK